MAPLAHLLLAACTLIGSLHAASVSLSSSEKKIPALIILEDKEPTDSGHELADLQEPVKEIENELRVKPAEDIPVAVVIEDVESSVNNNEVDGDETKRPQVDLRNPGPPQRQEHETQNPEQHSDEQLKSSTIKENIEQAQILLRQSFQNVADDIQSWVSNNEDQTKVQQNIQNFRESFGSQIQKLNVTIHGLTKPEESKPGDAQEETSEKDFEKIESRLKTLEDNFNNGLDTLSAGVNIVASLKSASEKGNDARQEPVDSTATTPAASPTTPANSAISTTPTSATTNRPNILVLATNTLAAAMNNSMQQLYQFFAPTSTPPPSVLSDQPEGTTARPPFINWPSPLSNWAQNFTLPNLNNNGPFSNPLNAISETWTNLFGSINRPPGGQPATLPPAVTSPVTGDKPVENQADQPAAAPAAAAAPAVSTPVTQPEGPIRQFLNNNPLINRITGAVQQLQNNIANTPERGRDPVEKNDSLSAKGGWYGNAGRPGGSGDNNNSGMTEQRAEEIKEPIQEQTKEEAEDDKEIRPEVASEKTE